jgi:hypothetical protein
MTISKKGRPLKFKNKNKLVKKIQEYFELCKTEDEIPTISGLAVYLDTSRETLCNYEKKEDYFDTIKKAKDTVVALQEQLAMKGKINPTVWIFSAKNNLGYVDKKENEVYGKDGKDLIDNSMANEASKAIAEFLTKRA